MGKPGKERQKKYLEKLKLKNKESYLQKERERKRKQRAEIKSNKKKYQVHLEKDRMRKKQTKGRSKCEFMYRTYPNQLEWYSVECTHMVRG